MAAGKVIRGTVGKQMPKGGGLAGTANQVAKSLQGVVPDGTKFLVGPGEREGRPEVWVCADPGKIGAIDGALGPITEGAIHVMADRSQLGTPVRFESSRGNAGAER